MGETVVGAAGGSVILIITLWPATPLDPSKVQEFAEKYTTVLGLVSDFFST